MNTTMRTDATVWTLDEKTDMWHGLCIECKGEKAKHTPQILKAKGLKPCGTCTDMKAYSSSVE
jgi:hypothetical protein